MMTDFQGVQDAALGALAEALARQPLSPGKVAFAWRAAVGPGIDRATEATLDASGTLHVRVSTPHWRHEVERARSLITARLARLLGPRVVQSIDVH